MTTRFAPFKAPDATVSTDKPVVTIGIPVFNSRKTLERALDSALSQTFREPYEIVIFDDGSTDNSFNICKAYQLRFPKIFRASRGVHRGVAVARNEIVNLSRGTYLTWLDADDYFFPTKLEQQVAALRLAEENNPLKKRLVLFSRYRIGSATIDYGQWMGDTLKHVLTGEFRAYLWASMARTDHYRSVGLFNVKLNRSEDQDWLLRLLRNRGRIVEDRGPAVIQYHFSTKRNGRHVEDSLDYIARTYGDVMKEKGVYEEFIPRRYWEIAGFYKSNGAWDDMWRCRGAALKLDFDRYFPRLIAEIINEMKTRDKSLQEEMRNYIDARLDEYLRHGVTTLKK